MSDESKVCRSPPIVELKDGYFYTYDYQTRSFVVYKATVGGEVTAAECGRVSDFCKSSELLSKIHIIMNDHKLQQVAT